MIPQTLTTMEKQNDNPPSPTTAAEFNDFVSDLISRDSSESETQSLAGGNRNRDTVLEFGKGIGIFLFEVELTASDVAVEQACMLLIPAETAWAYFRPHHTIRQELLISDVAGSGDWHMTVDYHHAKQAFVLKGGWTGFVAWNGLAAMDRIRFYLPLKSAYDRHYLIEFVRRQGTEVRAPPVFHRENFLFQVQLFPRHNGLSLILPKEEVARHFHLRRVPMTVRFTDAGNKTWQMLIGLSNEGDGYAFEPDKILKFVEENGLGAMDVIKFFRPHLPSMPRHYLIDFERFEGPGSSSSSRVIDHRKN